MTRPPPILVQIAAIDRQIDREREAEVPCFATLRALRERRTELRAFCDGAWRTDPGDDDTRPPAAAAARAA